MLNEFPWANEPGCGSCLTGDALDNLAGNADTIVSATDTQGNPDNIRLLQAFRVVDAKATPTDASLPLGLGGPHGMHPIVNDVDTRWNFRHKNYGSRGNDNCRTCHGADLKGTVLSRAAIDRVVTCKNTQGSLNCVADGNGDLKATIVKGQPVSCGMCHKQKK